MYCSQHTWIGRRPKCVPAKEDDYDDENGDNEEGVYVIHVVFIFIRD